MKGLEWCRTDRGIGWPRVVLVLVATAVAVATVASAATATAVFSPYNPTWEGSSEFRTLVDEHGSGDRVVVRDASRYGDLDSADTVAFVIGPTEPGGQEPLASFVENGGTLVVLDNFGSGNAVLESVGAGMRFDGRLLRDEQHNVNGPAMPVAPEVASHPLTAGVEQLSLNYATTIRAADAEVLVRSSPSGYLVESEDAGMDDRATELDSRPVAATEAVGDGTVVAVSDPSITINAMLGEPDNEQFLTRIITSAETVAVDQTHGGEVPVLVGAALVLRESPLAVAAVGILLIGGILALASGRRRSPTTSEAPPIEQRDEAMIEYLQREHPDWDREHVAKMITAFNRSRLKERDER